MRVNNLDLAVLADVMERGQSDPAVFRMHKSVTGTWNFTPGAPAYTSVVGHGQGSTELRVDIAPGFGGAGLAPDPLQYMLAGLGACYAATVVTVAALDGASIRALSVTAEQDANVAAVYDLGRGPLMERVSVTVTVEADADEETLARWQRTAQEKCPFAFTISNAVPLQTRVQRA